MKAHVCIGGPLDGLHATSADFRRESGRPGDPWHTEQGRYAEHGDDYLQFNTAYRYSTVLQRASKRLGHKLEECHVVWIHRSVLRPSRTLSQHEATL